jgi:hypothetical protein
MGRISLTIVVALAAVSGFAKNLVDGWSHTGTVTALTTAGEYAISPDGSYQNWSYIQTQATGGSAPITLGGLPLSIVGIGSAYGQAYDAASGFSAHFNNVTGSATYDLHLNQVLDFAPDLGPNEAATVYSSASDALSFTISQSAQISYTVSGPMNVKIRAVRGTITGGYNNGVYSYNLGPGSYAIMSSMTQSASLNMFTGTASNVGNPVIDGNLHCWMIPLIN